MFIVIFISKPFFTQHYCTLFFFNAGPWYFMGLVLFMIISIIIWYYVRWDTVCVLHLVCWPLTKIKKFVKDLDIIKHLVCICFICTVLYLNNHLVRNLQSSDINNFKFVLHKVSNHLLIGCCVFFQEWKLRMSLGRDMKYWPVIISSSNRLKWPMEKTSCTHTVM